MNSSTDSKKRILRLGITGNVCSGKSTVASLLHECFPDFVIVEADEIAKSLYKQRYVKEQLRKSLGAWVLDKDGEVNLSRLRKEIFEDDKKRRKVEKIVFPLVDEEVEKIYGKHPKTVLVSALLVEAQKLHLVEKVILTYAPKEVRLKRLMGRGLSRELAEKVLAAQLDDREKLKHVQLVLNTTAPREEIKKYLNRFLREKWGLN